jgi:hypothetical protein
MYILEIRNTAAALFFVATLQASVANKIFFEIERKLLNNFF